MLRSLSFLCLPALATKTTNAPVDVHTLVRRIGNHVSVVEMACNHQRIVPDVVSRVNIGPSVQQKRDCLKAALPPQVAPMIAVSSSSPPSRHSVPAPASSRKAVWAQSSSWHVRHSCSSRRSPSQAQAARTQKKRPALSLSLGFGSTLQATTVDQGSYLPARPWSATAASRVERNKVLLRDSPAWASPLRAARPRERGRQE